MCWSLPDVRLNFTLPFTTFWADGLTVTLVTALDSAWQNEGDMTRFSTGLTVRWGSMLSIRVAPRRGGGSSDLTGIDLWDVASSCQKFIFECVLSTALTGVLSQRESRRRTRIHPMQSARVGCCHLFAKGLIKVGSADVE